MKRLAIVMMVVSRFVLGTAEADPDRVRILREQRKACVEILGESCTVGFKARSRDNRAYTTCRPGSENDHVVIYWNPIHAGSGSVYEDAIHEAFHQYFWRKCGCTYTDVKGSRKHPRKGTIEGDATLAAKRYMQTGQMPDWGCDAT